MPQSLDSSLQFLPYGNAGANASLRTPVRMTFLYEAIAQNKP
ncbi:hypothetical protein [Nostoc sp. UHCC 0870]|nr:hypothetical protein [Nostoc sp. UHCC 0870]